VIDAETEHLRCCAPWIGLWTIHARPDFSCLLPKVRNVGICWNYVLSILNIDLFSCLRERYIWLDNLEVHKWLTFYVLQESRSLVGCNLLQFSANKSGRQDTARTKHVHCPSLGKPVSPQKPNKSRRIHPATIGFVMVFRSNMTIKLDVPENGFHG
jgi:hypothetical protein